MISKQHTRLATTILAAFIVAWIVIYLLRCFLQWINTSKLFVCKGCVEGGYTQDPQQYEGFQGAALNQQARIQRLAAGVRTDGYNMEIMPGENSVKVSFRGVPRQELPDDYRIKGYIMVLAQFDHNLLKVGHLNIRLSNEMQTEAVDSGGADGQEAAANNINGTNSLDNAVGNSICNKEDVCTYQFSNLAPRDPSTGNLYYYRLGVGIVYLDPEGEEHHSRLVPYGYGDGRQQEYFRIDIDQEAQERLLKRLEAIEGQNALTGGPATDVTNAADANVRDAAEDTGMEAYMRMLRPHLGNFPDEFLMNKQQRDDASLAKYMQQSLSVGSIDVNVDIPDVVPDA